MRLFGLATTALLVVLLTAPRSGETADESTWTLENGLRVTLKPLTTGEKIALVIVYDLGEDHDPEGQSGLAHLVEHCYVTSAAGKTPVRTAQEMMARYPMAWNAQTGARYTCVAFVFPKEKLAAEIEEAAARMGALEITRADLDREVPRMRTELANMFSTVSRLAASNRAWAGARPSPENGRKGGVISQIQQLSLGDVRSWYRRHYKPVNGRLVLLGPFDEARGRALVERYFGPIEKGEAPTGRAPGEASQQPIEEAGRRGGWLARAWRAPECDSEEYAPFVVLARRLMAHAMRRGTTGLEPFPQYAPLDAPEVLSIAKRIVPGESSAEAAAAIDAWVQEIADEPLGRREGIATARDFAWLLGTAPLPHAHLARDPYGPAFGIARRAQLGMDGSALARRLAAVDQAAFEAMFERVFGAGTGAAAAVVER